MKHSIKNPFPPAGKTASAVRNRKYGRKLAYTYFEELCLPAEKASNKSTKFVIKQKSVSTGQNEGFPEKYDFTGPKSYVESVSEKRLKKTASFSRSKIF